MLIGAVALLIVAGAIIFFLIRHRLISKSPMVESGLFHLHTAKNVLESVQCNDDIKTQLLITLKEQRNNPNKLRKQFQILLDESGLPWQWPWLDDYPDTQGKPAHILADTMMRADALVEKITTWANQSRIIMPYLLIKSIGADNDYPECKATNGTLLELGKPCKTITLPHRPGCTCYVLACNNVMLKQFKTHKDEIPTKESL